MTKDEVISLLHAHGFDKQLRDSRRRLRALVDASYVRIRYGQACMLVAHYDDPQLETKLKDLELRYERRLS